MDSKRQFPTFYRVSFWNGEETIQTQGFIFASTFADAAEQIAGYYGDSDIDSMEIFMTEEDYVLEIEDKDLWWKLFRLRDGKDVFRE